MKKFVTFQAFFAVLVALVIAFPALAQDGQNPADEKVMKIKVVKTENGETTVTEEEVPMGSETEVESILKGLGIEMGKMSDDESMEIVIRKRKTSGHSDEDVNVIIEAYGDRGETVTKPFLGVMLDASADGNGAGITEIIEGTEAAKTDLQAGDVITAIDGQKITNFNEAVDLIRAKNIGDEVAITYTRDGVERNTTSKLGEKTETPEIFWKSNSFGGENHFEWKRCDTTTCDPKDCINGIYLRNEEKETAFLGVTPGDAEAARGVTLGRIVENSAASEMGLQNGDVVTTLNGKAVNSWDELAEVIQSLTPGEQINVEGLRGNEAFSYAGALKSSREKNHDPHIQKRIEVREFGGNANKAFLGVTPGNTENIERGVEIGTVVHSSTAETIGLQANDIILEINDKPVNSFEQLAKVLSTVEPGSEVKVEYLRNGKKAKAKGEIMSRKSMGCASSSNYMEWQAPMIIGDDVMFLDIDTDEMYEINEQVERALEEAFGELEQEGVIVGEDMERLREEMEKMKQEIERNMEFHSIAIFISVEEVSKDEVEAFNKVSTEKLPVNNDLELADMSFFPNPSDGIVNLQFELPESGSTTIEVFSEKGEKVFSETLLDFQGQYTNQLDIRDRAQGTYFVKVSQNGKMTTKKLIKR